MTRDAIEVNEKRIVFRREGEARSGPVVYWMSRDQRVADNWALLYAQQEALALKVPLVTVFCLAPAFLGATIRHYGFMLRGLREVAARLAELAIPFILLHGPADKELPRFVERRGASLLVTDFNPLRIKLAWDAAVADQLRIPFRVLDAHNIVPCPLASPKQEYAARTFRPKIRKLLPEFLSDFPRLRRHPVSWSGTVAPIVWEKVMRDLHVDRSVAEVSWLEPGERAAHQALRAFLEERLASYNDCRNDPTKQCQSDLSPYLHFGQLSPQRVALEAGCFDRHIQSQESFLEELVVRRELSDNFCFYNPAYDSVSGFPAWGREALERHRRDPRQPCYSVERFEAAETHDALWNAAQREMVRTGKMHGYLRMYWAKKILEWSASPEEALETAIRLNDRYELDGRDPNGYTGIAWSIGGVHDRAWPERPIYGKIRSMSLAGCRRKFDVERYVDRFRKENDRSGG